MRLYIIRHAQSENNALWSRTGSSEGRNSDPLLTETGQKQAHLLADYLAQADPGVETDYWDVSERHGFGITHLYTSLMQRAVLTATAIAQALDLPLLAWPEIHEQGGIFEYDPDKDERRGLPGPNRAFFAERYPHLTLPDSITDQGWWNGRYEDRTETLQRARLVAAEVFERHGKTDDRLALVTHGAFGHYLLSVLLNRSELDNDGPNPTRPWLMMNNTGITRLGYTSEYATLFYTNRLEHLPRDLITD